MTAAGPCAVTRLGSLSRSRTGHSCQFYLIALKPTALALVTLGPVLPARIAAGSTPSDVSLL
jgi:hypothetical protein